MDKPYRPAPSSMARFSFEINNVLSIMFPRIRASIYKDPGSIACDHLAAERTFLAWLRTGLGFVALGIAVDRFSQFDIDALRSPSMSTFSNLAQLRTAVEKTPNEGYRRDRATTSLVLGLLGTGTGSFSMAWGDNSQI